MKPLSNANAALVTFLSVAWMVTLSEIALLRDGHLLEYFSADRERILGHYELWRILTSSWVHADQRHLISNLILFTPLSYLLCRYYGLFAYPVLTIAVGIFDTTLLLFVSPSFLGASGLVFFMGALWITLLSFDRQDLPPIIKAGFILFVIAYFCIPHPQVFNSGHFISAIFGFASGIACLKLR